MARRGKGKCKIVEDECEYKYNEKEQLLKALKENGPSVISDLDLLKTYLPSNTLPEIKFLIESYEKKGRELSQRENFIDSYPEMKNIAQWSSIISYCVPFDAKCDDFSQTLKDVFVEMGKLFSTRSGSMENINIDENGGESTSCIHDEEKVNYQAVHSYFQSILDGRFPVKLDDREASIVLAIIENLIEMVESVDDKDEKDFLTSEAWWLPGQANGLTSNPQVEGTINEPQISQNLNQNRPECYEDLPRIRKIRECLNPLKIPKNILDQNHDLMTTFLS